MSIPENPAPEQRAADVVRCPIPLGASYTVKSLCTIESLESLRETWSSVQRHPESDIDFVTFIIRQRPEILHPYVLAVYANDRLVSLLAGRVERARYEIKAGYKVIWRVPVSQIAIFYGGLMGQTSPEIVELVVRRLRQSLIEEKADLLSWSGVPKDASLYRALKQAPSFFCRDYQDRPAPHWLMSLPASLEELLEKRMNKKHRYWARRIMRLLEKDFPNAVALASFSTPQQMARFFEEVLQVARKTYQWGLGVGFRDNQEQRERLLLEAARGWHRGYILRIQGRPVAFWICALYQSTAYSAYTGYDPAYRQHEVGTVLFLRMIGELCREGVKQFDFGLGTALYKERFGDSSFEESTVCVFAASPRGVFLNGLRTVTEGPMNWVRGVLHSLGLEQKLKTMWRRRVAPRPVGAEAVP